MSRSSPLLATLRRYAALVLCAALVALAVGVGVGRNRDADATGVLARAATIARRPCAGRRPPTGYRHVIWVVLENRAYSDIVRAPQAPYLNALARRCGLATNFHAEAHPSLPNYIAMPSGSTHGVRGDPGPASLQISGPSIFSQVGGRWRSLQDRCPAAVSAPTPGSMWSRSTPALYYRRLRRGCARRDLPLARRSSVVARFTLVVPDLCHDTHSCPVSVGDHWLAGWLPRVLRTRAYRAGATAVIVTWDEDDRTAAQHIPTLVVAPSVRPGTRSRRRFNHYSMLRTTERLLRLRYLGHARRARGMAAAFHLAR